MFACVVQQPVALWWNEGHGWIPRIEWVYPPVGNHILMVFERPPWVENNISEPPGIPKIGHVCLWSSTTSGAMAKRRSWLNLALWIGLSTPWKLHSNRIWAPSLGGEQYIRTTWNSENRNSLPLWLNKWWFYEEKKSRLDSPHRIDLSALSRGHSNCISLLSLGGEQYITTPKNSENWASLPLSFNNQWCYSETRVMVGFPALNRTCQMNKTNCSIV